MSRVVESNKALIAAYAGHFAFTLAEQSYYLSRLLDRCGWDTPATREQFFELLSAEFYTKRTQAAQKLAHVTSQIKYQQGRVTTYQERERLLNSLQSSPKGLN